MSRRLVSFAERSGMRAMRLAGSSVSDILDAHPRWSESCVRYHIQGLPPVGRKKRIVDPVAAIRLRESGLGYGRIGQRFGVTKVGAYLAIKRELQRRGGEA